MTSKLLSGALTPSSEWWLISKCIKKRCNYAIERIKDLTWAVSELCFKLFDSVDFMNGDAPELPQPESDGIA